VLAGTRRLVGASNQLFADLLAHLAEVETRGIHRNKACASLYTYCIYELQFSEDAAFRRVSAARFVKAFPSLLEAVAHGELHLTGLLMIAPHLTATNQAEVLARAKHRTKKELAKLVRELDPLPDVPARIAPLGPAPEPRSPLRNPTWAEYVASMVPVRHLKPGERPREWIDEPTIANAFEQAANTVDRPVSSDFISSFAVPSAALDAESEAPRTASNVAAPARRVESVTCPQRHAVQFTASQEYVDLVQRAKALLSHTGGTSLEELHLRAMQCLVAQLEKRRYGAPKRERRVFAEEYAQLQPEVDRPVDANLERARGGRNADGGREDERGEAEPVDAETPEAELVDAEACDSRGGEAESGVAQRGEAKSGRTTNVAGSTTAGMSMSTADMSTADMSTNVAGSTTAGMSMSTADMNTSAAGVSGAAESVLGESATAQSSTAQSGVLEPSVPGSGKAGSRNTSPSGPEGTQRTRGETVAAKTPLERSRNIPARIRRRVFERDEGRCTFTDEAGCRCREVERLELHHVKPFALHGQHHADNLTLRCQAHNALAAEQDFGREVMVRKRDAAPHASWAANRG
jgi:5-methylcytosine-specific restriction endonuclease McrA